MGTIDLGSQVRSSTVPPFPVGSLKMGGPETIEMTHESNIFKGSLILRNYQTKSPYVEIGGFTD